MQQLQEGYIVRWWTKASTEGEDGYPRPNDGGNGTKIMLLEEAESICQEMNAKHPHLSYSICWIAPSILEADIASGSLKGLDHKIGENQLTEGFIVCWASITGTLSENGQAMPLRSGNGTSIMSLPNCEAWCKKMNDQYPELNHVPVWITLERLQEEVAIGKLKGLDSLCSSIFNA